VSGGTGAEMRGIMRGINLRGIVIIMNTFYCAPAGPKYKFSGSSGRVSYRQAYLVARRYHAAGSKSYLLIGD